MFDDDAPRHTLVDPTMDFASRRDSRGDASGMAEGSEARDADAGEKVKVYAIEGIGEPSDELPRDTDSAELPAEGRGSQDLAKLHDRSRTTDAVRRRGQRGVWVQPPTALSDAPAELEVEGLSARSYRWPLMGLGVAVAATVAGVLSLVSGPSEYAPSRASSSRASPSSLAGRLLDGVVRRGAALARRAAAAQGAVAERATAAEQAAVAAAKTQREALQAVDLEGAVADERLAAPAGSDPARLATTNPPISRMLLPGAGTRGHTASASRLSSAGLGSAGGELPAVRNAGSSSAHGPIAGGAGPLVSGPLVSGPFVSGPFVSGPLVSGPLVSGPLVSGSPAAGPPEAVPPPPPVPEESPTRYGKMRKGKPF